ncbi:MAG: N-acetylmuramoyl-L-alanine amidase [Acidobacteria bacterium]|nr:N-acetylmuramoyl-L-alanine amidase [Acidobacteriota bacterium]
MHAAERSSRLMGSPLGRAAILGGLCVLTLAGASESKDLVEVTAIRFWTLGDVTRVAVETSGETRFVHDRLHNPERIFFDLRGARTRLGKNGFQAIPVGDRLVRQIRTAQTKPDVVRVVVDLESDSEFTASQLANPSRLIIELRPATRAAAAAPPVPAPEIAAPPAAGAKPPRAPEAKPVEVPPAKAAAKETSPAKTAAKEAPPTKAAAKETSPARAAAKETPPARAEAKETPPAKAAAEETPPARASAKETPPAQAVAKETPPAKAAAKETLSAKAAAEETAPDKAAAKKAPPAKAAAKEPPPAQAAAKEPPPARAAASLTRVLGLKIGRVVIDPGHGGHDRGTTGPTGLAEKELVLDLAKRLGALIEEQLGSEVVYTRTEDIFVPLETRTEIANDAKADLFLSIHANSSPFKTVTGVETYYLNFTTSRADLEVAARENATSQKSIHELTELLQKIALKDKVEESREFASKVQSSLHSVSLRQNSRSRNRGVKKAPFVVLIGASMPSVLVEIGFVSNARDEALLKKSDHRQRVAEALYKGLSLYAGTLSHFQVAQTTAP